MQARGDGKFQCIHMVLGARYTFLCRESALIIVLRDEQGHPIEVIGHSIAQPMNRLGPNAVMGR